MRLKGLLVITLMLFVLGAVIVGCSVDSDTGNASASTASGESTRVSIGPQKGKLAPDFTLPSLDGQEITLSDLRGRPILALFWATWCGQCREELSQLKTIYEDYKDQELVILAIDLGESESRVRDFVTKEEVPLTILMDQDERTARSYRIAYLPTNFLIDRQGIIQEVRIGRYPNTEDLIESLGKILWVLLRNE